MKALALITDYKSKEKNQWQFDKIMSAIAYDLDLKVVFINNGIQQLKNNKAWKCLPIYGVIDVFYQTGEILVNNDCMIEARQVSNAELKSLIKQAEIII